MGIEVPAPFLHASQHAPGGTDPVLGIVAADIDSAITFWDDPLGMGMATSGIVGMLTTFGVITASRAVFSRLIAGSVVGKLYWGVQVSSGNVDIGIYDNTGSRENARPNARQFSTGSIPCPSIGNTTTTVSPTITCKARQHWYGFAPDNATASFWNWSGSVLVSTLSAGWTCYKDASFPLPATVTTPTVGNIRNLAIVGRPT